MKGLLFIFLSLVSWHLSAQTSFGSFKAEDQELKFQKVLTDDSVTAEKLEAYYKTLPYLSNVSSNGQTVHAQMNDVTVDYRKFQFRQMDVPTLVQTGKYSAKVQVDVKEGRYRITMTSIMVSGDAGYRKITANESLTSFACKNSGTVLNPDWCKPNTLGLLEQVFTDKLLFVSKKKSDW